jgi:hypothetical protein
VNGPPQKLSTGAILVRADPGICSALARKMQGVLMKLPPRPTRTRRLGPPRGGGYTGGGNGSGGGGSEGSSSAGEAFPWRDLVFVALIALLLPAFFIAVQFVEIAAKVVHAMISGQT